MRQYIIFSVSVAGSKNKTHMLLLKYMYKSINFILINVFIYQIQYFFRRIFSSSRLFINITVLKSVTLLLRNYVNTTDIRKYH